MNLYLNMIKYYKNTWNPLGWLFSVLMIWKWRERCRMCWE